MFYNTIHAPINTAFTNASMDVLRTHVNMRTHSDWLLIQRTAGCATSPQLTGVKAEEMLSLGLNTDTQQCGS